MVFPKLLSTNSDDFTQTNMMFNADDRKSGSCRRFCCERLSDTVNSYTLEVSMCGYYLKGSEVLTQYTEDGCNNITNHYVGVVNILIIHIVFRYAVRSKCRPYDFRVLSLHQCVGYSNVHGTKHAQRTSKNTSATNETSHQPRSEATPENYTNQCTD